MPPRDRLTAAQIAVLRVCVEDNPTGRAGWPIQDWEARVRSVCEPLFRRGLLKERRLGGFAGIQITEAGRRALEEADHGG